MTADYSATAERQLDDLENDTDIALYLDVLQACKDVLDHPETARIRSAAVTTENGIVFRLPVKGRYPYKIFWTQTEDSVCIEAVFRYS